MNVKDAQQKAKEYLKNTNLNIIACADIGDAFVFDYAKLGCEADPGNHGVEVNKKTGETKLFFLPDETNFKRLKKAKKIKI